MTPSPKPERAPLPARPREGGADPAARADAHPCPICRRPVPEPPANQAWPFCCPRCRLIDLGRWLGGGYCIEFPLEEADGQAEE